MIELATLGLEDACCLTVIPKREGCVCAGVERSQVRGVPCHVVVAGLEEGFSQDRLWVRPEVDVHPISRLVATTEGEGVVACGGSFVQTRIASGFVEFGRLVPLNYRRSNIGMKVVGSGTRLAGQANHHRASAAAD